MPRDRIHCPSAIAGLAGGIYQGERRNEMLHDQRQEHPG